MNRKLPYKDDFEMQQLLNEVFTPTKQPITEAESFEVEENDPNEELDGQSILEKYMAANRLRYDDVKSFERVCAALGYEDSYGDVIRNFFGDNPGALEKVYEFIAEWVTHNEEWKEALTEEEDYSDEDANDEREERYNRGH